MYINIIVFISALLYLKINSSLALDFECPTNLIQINGEQNIKEYCSIKTCVTKCCEKNEFIFLRKNKFKCKTFFENFNNTKTFLDIFKENHLTLNLNDLEFYNTSDKSKSNKTFSDHFNILNNGIHLESNCYKTPNKINNDRYLREDGTLEAKSINSWYTAERQSFCVDVLMGIKKTGKAVKMYYVLELKEKISNTKSIFLSCALMISCFFIILVLVVYSVLPHLRSLGGLLLMAYLSSLLGGNLIKAITTIVNIVAKVDGTLCENFLSPVMYFFIMSSFMWLNIMSFDMWWTFRGEYYHRAIHRKGEFVKFMWYALAVGTISGAMTITVVLIDKKSSLKIKPLLSSFLQNNEANQIYLYAPMSFLTACNFMFFLMTVFNIWRIKRDITKMNKVSLSKKNKMFRSFMRISLLMGVSWILEMIQGYIDDTPDWLFIVINLYNGCIGAVFFLFFVCNKETFKKLCKRFNIKNKIVQDNLNSSTRTTTSRPSTKKGSYSRTRTDDTFEMTEDPMSQTNVSNRHVSVDTETEDHGPPPYSSVEKKHLNSSTNV